jgi:hypothetical protein
LDIDKMLATIRGQLEKQREEQEMTEKQLVQYIETRVKQLEKARKSRKAKAGRK